METRSKFMLSFKRYFALLLLLCVPCALFADPPKPPLGKRWVLNPLFSDEFNGNSLDATKWYDHHPTWIGRPPGLFLPSQVSVRDGYLQIRGEKMDKDTVIHAYGRDITFNIAGGAVRSKNQAYLGYYECRVKAAATTMSTTFWFSGGGGVGPEGCDSYHQEWDIQECIGRNGDFDGSYFGNGMHANAHYWYTDCEGERFDHRAEQVKFEDSELASENFHVYGGWWRDASTASYYYDKREPKYQKFYDKISKTPMDKPMHMNLVCETYPFPWIELPNDEELSDPTKNTVYYDWVRGYKLIDAWEPLSADLKTETLPEIFDEALSFPAAILELKPSGTLSIPLTYKANQDRLIHLALYDEEENKIWETSFPVYAGYAHMTFDCEIAQDLLAATGYKLEGILHPGKSAESENLESEVLDSSVMFIDLTGQTKTKSGWTTPLSFSRTIKGSHYLQSVNSGKYLFFTSWEHSPAIFSPDGNEVFWEVIQSPGTNNTYRISFTKSMLRIDNKWTRPEVVPYTNPYFSVDGKRLYFTGYDHGFCFIEKAAEAWSDWQCPDLFSENPELKQGFGYSITQDGTLYFSSVREGLGTLNDYGIYRAEFVDGRYKQSELLPSGINQAPYLNWTPFISPDESYLLFSSNRHSQDDYGDLYITFRLSDGNWSEPLNLGEPVNSWAQERFPGISPDSKYLFFTRWTKEHDQDVYWVSTGVIEEIKKNHEKKK